MYNDAHWAIQLMNYMSQTCLKKNISLLKQKSPSISYENSIEHITLVEIGQNVTILFAITCNY